MQVVLHTNYGDITLAMHTETAPKTVENFLQYARDGFYENTLFHRVIDNFMVQGGGRARHVAKRHRHYRKRSQNSKAEPDWYGRNGTHPGSTFSLVTVLYQCERQPLP